MATPLHEGYTDMENAVLWDRHIRLARDPFRESPQGLYYQITNWVLECGFDDNSHLADICCGQGVTSNLASYACGARVTGIDLSAPLISLSMQYGYHNPKLDFKVGSADDLSEFGDGEFDGAMMINGIFHLPTVEMFESLSELSRVSKGPILVTSVNPPAYEFFASAFKNPKRSMESLSDLEPIIIITGDPEIAGPGDTRIVLTDTPFVMHPERNLSAAIGKAGLQVTGEDTFGPVSLVGGPDGLDLFTIIELEHRQ